MKKLRNDFVIYYEVKNNRLFTITIGNAIIFVQANQNSTRTADRLISTRKRSMTMENRVNDDDKSCVGQESSQLAIVPEDIQLRVDLEWLAKQMSIIGANRRGLSLESMNAMVERLRRKYPRVRLLCYVLCYYLRNFKWWHNASLIETIIMIDYFRYSFHYVRFFLIEIFFEK